MERLRPTISHMRGTAPGRAFTILELIVVIAIIAVLIGILAPALGGAKRRAAKHAEMHNIKQLGHAWMLYANSSGDAALPGFLERTVQEKPVAGISRGWGVRYKYPDRSLIPLNPQNLTGPWTWRLLSYLDYDHQLIHAHLDESDPNPFNLVTEGIKTAYEPAFAYNGWHIGGWWVMVNVNGVMTPRMKFHDHCGTDAPRSALHIPTGVAQIKRPSDMVTFCSATRFVTPGLKTRLAASTPGWQMVMPPTLAATEQWKPAAGDPVSAVEILQPNTWAPIGRHTGVIAVLHADGHVDEQGYNALLDQRKWINSADSATYTHGPCAASP
jgi:prepilin-type N-terminal cleavage/methylation domain-containing protein